VSASSLDLPPAPDYGLDAPGVVRNLALASFAGLLFAALILAGVVPESLSFHPSSGVEARLGLIGVGLGPGIACGAAAIAMVWGSRVGKLRERERLLGALPWDGNEQVLDVGCGRGLLLVGAARRLRTGKAIGVDLWRAEDLAGNRPEATLANARAEGVADRVRVETADMRQLPFSDGTFDRVVSRAAIHNIDDSEGRARAIREIARVMKPGGFAIIDDIRHLGDYNATFEHSGCRILGRLDSRLESLFWTVLSFGSLRPGAWLIQRMA
jgi:SAM-dependent methyltransferase